MKLPLIIFLILFLAFCAVQVHWLQQRAGALTKEYEGLTAQLVKTERDKLDLQADLEYYTNPANIEKELRARFNYRARDEKLIIIVPQPSQTRLQPSQTRLRAASSSASGTVR